MALECWAASAKGVVGEMSELNEAEAALVDRLLDIIAREGLVDRAKLDMSADVAEVGLSQDDLTLVGNAIEREFDRDMLHDDALHACRSVRELVTLIATRVAQSEGAIDERPAP
jgi:hypothetical protein